VSCADALFTPDTSVAHAAAAFGVPTVDMLLTGKASQWGLYRAPGVNLESPDDSLLSLTAAAAGTALQQLLTEVMLRQRRPDATSHPSAA
jgi:ADP-heptose:LPS heptosyltransferase